MRTVSPIDRRRRAEAVGATLPGLGRLAGLALVTAVTVLNLLTLAGAVQRSRAVFTDTLGNDSNTFSTASCFPNSNNIYVRAITLSTKQKGSNHEETYAIEVRRDSDADCVAEGTDAGVNADPPTLTGELRDASNNLIGSCSTSSFGPTSETSCVFSNVPNGTFTFTVTGLTHSTWTWNQGMGVSQHGPHVVPH